MMIIAYAVQFIFGYLASFVLGVLMCFLSLILMFIPPAFNWSWSAYGEVSEYLICSDHCDSMFGGGK